jgi:hypothetical protein
MAPCQMPPAMREPSSLFKLAEYLLPVPSATWMLARQAGVMHEKNLAPGNSVLGRLFAIGYIKGLAEGVAKTAGT